MTTIGGTPQTDEAPRTVSLVYEQRPWLMNGAQRIHPMQRRRLVEEWRTAFAWLSRVDRLPPLRAVHITVIHHRRNRGSMADVGAVMPAAKASIDGLVDAGVLRGDGPDVVRSLTFLAPVVSGKDALELVITEALA